MKRNLIYNFFGLAVVLMVFGCTKEDKYQTSVVRDFNLFLNGEPFAVNPGITTKPFFIYKRPSGEYFGNYMSHYRFALPNGGYWFVATPAPAQLIPDSSATTNLKDLVINQFPRADQQVQISAVAEYNSPFSEPLNLNMISRTGTLRLKATDTQPDNTYTSIRAVVTVKRSGYRLFDESFIETPLEVTRSKATDKGGVNYTDDFVLFKTKDEQNGVNVRFELLDKDGLIVRTRTLNGSIPIMPDTITVVDLSLNSQPDPAPQASHKISVQPTHLR